MHATPGLFNRVYEHIHGRDTTKLAATPVIQRLPQEALESSGVDFIYPCRRHQHAVAALFIAFGTTGYWQSNGRRWMPC